MDDFIMPGGRESMLRRAPSRPAAVVEAAKLCDRLQGVAAGKACNNAAAAMMKG